MEKPKNITGDPKTDIEIFKAVFSEDAAFKFRGIKSEKGALVAALCSPEKANELRHAVIAD